MAYTTKVVAKPSLAKFLIDRYQQKRHEKGVFYSQNAYASDEIGIIPQTFSRYASGYDSASKRFTVDEITMSMDQAAILLSYYGLDIVEHFEFTAQSSMTYHQAISIALTAKDQDIAATLKLLANMPEQQRQAISAAILRLASGEEAHGNNHFAPA